MAVDSMGLADLDGRPPLLHTMSKGRFAQVILHRGYFFQYSDFIKCSRVVTVYNGANSSSERSINISIYFTGQSFQFH